VKGTVRAVNIGSPLTGRQKAEFEFEFEFEVWANEAKPR
jgi:hypothetical protein